MDTLLNNDKAEEQALRKPTTRKGKKFLEAREPKVLEGPRQTLFIKGTKTSQNIQTTLKNLVTDLMSLCSSPVIASMISRKWIRPSWLKSWSINHSNLPRNSSIFVTKETVLSSLLGNPKNHFLLVLLSKLPLETIQRNDRIILSLEDSIIAKFWTLSS